MFHDDVVAGRSLGRCIIGGASHHPGPFPSEARAKLCSACQLLSSTSSNCNNSCMQACCFTLTGWPRMVVETDPDPGAGGLRRRVGAMLSGTSKAYYHALWPRT